MADRLLEKDLFDLLERTISAAPKWRYVGLGLGFLDSELDEIEAADKDPKECFRKMLSRWLKWAKPNHDYPSSHALTKALRSKMVREELLANDLEQYFSETDTKDTETVEPPPTANAATTSLPHTDTRHTVMVESPTPKPRTIQSYFEWLLQDCVVGGHLMGSSDSRTPLVQRYNNLTRSVKEALKKRGISARAIFDALIEKNQAESTAYLKNVLKQAAHLQGPAEVLDSVTSDSNFMDYGTLEHLIKTFKLTEVEEELERYKKDLPRFLLPMMEAPPDTDPPPRKKSRVGPDPEVRREQGTLV